MKLGIISKGKQLIGKLKPSSGKSEGGFIYNAIKPFMKLVPEGQPLFPLKAWKYCGPGNRLDNGPPKNSTDAVCETHDYAYSRAFEETTKSESNRLEREADLQMLESLKQIQPADFNERVGWHLANAGINAKVGLENFGNKLIGLL